MFSKLHNEESKLKMRIHRLGKILTEETKLKISLTNSRKVFVYKYDSILDRKVLIKDFNSYTEVAHYFNCSIRTISRYIDKYKLYKKEFYIYTKSQ